MKQDLTIAQQMLPLLSATSGKKLLDRPELCLAQSGSIKVCYAPFDHIATDAKLVVVGITPGLTQAVNALEAAYFAREAGLPLESILAKAKLTASFSGGPIRSNLVAMLDAIGVARHFAVSSTAALFQPGSTAVHFTSALRYPVFVNGANYNGTPDMLATPLLRSMIERHLTEEALHLPEAIWLPLGPKAQAAVMHMVRMGHLKPNRVLNGMPHPSGANAERVGVFLGKKDPAAASRQTNPAPLIAAFSRLKTQISLLEGEAA